MAARKARGNGEGSVYRQGGKWKAVVTFYEGGRRLRKTASRQNRRDAVEALHDLKQQVRNRPENADAGMTLDAWADQWLDHFVKPNLANTTYCRHKGNLKRYVRPHLGHHRLENLRPHHVQAMLSAMSEKGIGAATRESTFSTVRACIGRANKIGLISTAPTYGVVAAKAEPKKIEVFSPEELDAICNQLEGCDCDSLVRFMAGTGLRISEALAVEWSDITGDFLHVQRQLDTRHGRMEVRRPKTKRSIRKVPVTEETLAILEQHKRRLEEMDLLRDHVFVSPEGHYIRYDNFRQRVWNEAVRQAEVPHRSLHCLRHTYATHLLRSGVSINAVSQILGHSTPSVTLNVYGHVVSRDFDHVRTAIADIAGSVPVATLLPLEAAECDPKSSRVNASC